MSDAEKAAQVGEAMLLLESQKRELAHLEAKVEKVKQAYRAFAANVDRWRIDVSSPKKVFLSHPNQEERDLASCLLAESDLAALITERETAKAALQQTKVRLASFGITV